MRLGVGGCHIHRYPHTPSELVPQSIHPKEPNPYGALNIIRY